MKNIKIAALVLSTLAVFIIGSTSASAYYRDPHYRYGHNGYWDHGNRYHRWESWHGHRGYWHRRDDGVRVFINI